MQEPRQPEPTYPFETQHSNQTHRSHVPEPIPGDEFRTSHPPAGRPNARDVSVLREHKESACRTQLPLQVPAPHQYSEYPDVPPTNVSLHRVCLAVVG
jgi:hypothetical protein